MLQNKSQSIRMQHFGVDVNLNCTFTTSIRCIARINQSRKILLAGSPPTGFQREQKRDLFSLGKQAKLS